MLNIVRRVLFECAPSLRHTFSRLPIASSRRRRFVRLFQGRVVRLIGFCRMSERERVGFSLSFRHTFSGLVGSPGRRFCSPSFPRRVLYFARLSAPVFRVMDTRASMTEPSSCPVASDSRYCSVIHFQGRVVRDFFVPISSFLR